MTSLARLDRMDAALGFGPAAPAPGARILIRKGPAGARHAADRQEPLCKQWMRRQPGGGKDLLDVLSRDIGEGIEFQPRAVLFDDRNLRAQAALKALAPVDPGIEGF